MRLSTIRTIKNFCEDLTSQPDWREVVGNINNNESDFEVDNVRFILSDDIDQIQADELESDLYCLGCFNATFIADQCNWPLELVEVAQNGEAFEALGKAIADNCDMVEFAKAYSSADGYGHHFNHYDFSEDEINVNGVLYHVFDNRC